jgi:hypothetical protein
VAAEWSAKRSGIGLYPHPDGVLVKPDGTEIRAWGDPRVRRHVSALLARMQYDFARGKMAPVCKHVDPQLLSSVYLGGVEPGASCERKLDAYARELDREGFRPSPLRLLWVRAYPGIAGVWVEGGDGSRFRVPFVQRGNGRWLLELSELEPREALAMPLRVAAGGE